MNPDAAAYVEKSIQYLIKITQMQIRPFLANNPEYSIGDAGMHILPEEHHRMIGFSAGIQLVKANGVVGIIAVNEYGKPVILQKKGLFPHAKELARQLKVANGFILTPSVKNLKEFVASRSNKK
ncbi:MAG: hypothetical protein AABX01_02295 [Candidatus Micrarchaeota archaeon]